MDEAAIIKEFDRPTPRKACLKRDSPEEGIGFNPWSIFGELSGCGGPILGAFLLLAWATNFNLVASVPLIVFGAAVGILATSWAVGALSEGRYHKHFAQDGEAVIGRATQWKSERTEDDTTRVTIEGSSLMAVVGLSGWV